MINREYNTYSSRGIDGGGEHLWTKSESLRLLAYERALRTGRV